MDWIDTIERFNTWGKYPFATVIHWIVGAYCGVKLAYGKFTNNMSETMIGVIVFLGWIAYETTEYLTERDSPDVDIANGLGGLKLGLILYYLYHKFVKS